MGDVLSSILAFAGGSVVTLIITWRLNRSDKDRDQKRIIIADCRKALIEDWTNEEQYRGIRFDSMGKHEYLRVRPYLTDDFLKKIDEKIKSGYLGPSEGRSPELPSHGAK